ncbi:unnamed protein product [Leptosia nina]|uniref:Uncharacterized protein n=1 Tax=Leptosia nina TaxID=320188 RepID=A0AAV1JFS9_9NEOP
MLHTKLSLQVRKDRCLLTIRKEVSGAITDNQFLAGYITWFDGSSASAGAPQPLIYIIKGYRIPFITKPPHLMPENQRITLESMTTSAAIAQMLSQKVLKQVPASPSFVSPIFLVPKPDDRDRPILNLSLKALNKFVKTKPKYS